MKLHETVRQAYEHLTFRLSRFGNNLSAEHRTALKTVLTTYHDIYHGRSPTTHPTQTPASRYAIPLAVGTGKTQSIVSFAKAQYEADSLSRGLLICAEQINALADLRSDLIDAGIPAEEIGFIHSKRPRDVGVRSSEAPYSRFPILLISHALLKVRDSIEPFTDFPGGPEGKRALTCYDEALVAAEGRSLMASIIDQCVGASMRGILGDFAQVEGITQEAKRALGYIEECLKLVKAELDRQKAQPNTPPRQLVLPYRSYEDREVYGKALREASKQDRTLYRWVAPLQSFLLFTSQPLRVVRLGSGRSSEGAISYRLRVPEELRNVVILDASHSIRELIHHDRSIEVLGGCDWKAVKSFKQVTVTQILMPGGRNTVEKLRKNSRMVKTIVERVKTTPPHEGVIFFSYKPKGRRLGPLDKIKDALEDAGIDLSATVQVRIKEPGQPARWEQRPRFVWLTWGNEKGLSRYAYCKNVIVAGVLRRSHLDLSANIAGAKRSVLAPQAASLQEVRRIETSEQFHCLLQAIGRSSCREVQDGLAKPADVLVLDQADFSELVQDGMPGVQWEVQEDEAGRKRHRNRKHDHAPTKTENRAGQIVAVLRESDLPEKISVTKLKRLTQMTDVPAESFKLARDKALSSLDGEWELQGRSLVRCA